MMAEPAAVVVGPCRKTRWVGAPGVMLKPEEVAGAYDGELFAVRVYPVPVLLMERPEKVATPAVTVVAEPPASDPPPGFVPIVKVTCVRLSPVSTLPFASSTATVTAGEIAEPATVVVGPWRKTRCAGVPGVMLKADEVAAVYGDVVEAARV